ncbi:MAG: MFS transporter [Clostridia bacterium]|nr:MFS transporter [Clostridia bacterium]
MYKKELQVKKFAYYGFLKNLRFFEPFILLYLVSLNISLYQIGLLYALREAIIYLFEIPSGVFADRYGKKLELIICFIFYIISFVFFFIGKPVVFIAFAMFFFGLGEAFRSGTHKAMIMTYLDKNAITYKKSEVYGYTRSYSLIGSSISSLIAIILIYFLPATRYIFLVTIIPYLADFYLILTYPEYLNEKVESKFTVKSIFIEAFHNLKNLFTDRKLLYYVFNSSFFESVFKTSKDYIQVLVFALIVSSGITFGTNFTSDDVTYIILGLVYSVIYIISSYATRNTHKLIFKNNIDKTINLLWFIMAFTMFLIFIFSELNLISLVIVFYLLSYVIMNLRIPLVLEKLGDNMESNKRATYLSVESQLQSLFVFFLAPFLGYIADTYGVPYGFAAIGVLLLLVSPILSFLRKKA